MKRMMTWAIVAAILAALVAGCTSTPEEGTEQGAEQGSEQSAEQGGGAAMAESDPMNKAISLRILHTNDHHSHLDGHTYDLVIGGVPTRLQMGGFSRLVSIIERERNANTLVLNSGELNGTLYFSMFKGEPDFKVFNELGLDAYALGNHEFDEGDGRLAELIEMANFPIVSGNAQPEPASALYRVRDQILPYVIKEIEGEPVAIIGILKVEKTKMSSLVSEDVTFTPEIEAASAIVAELEAQGINKIVLLSHVGYYNDIVLAKEVAGIDVIVGGDTHSLLGDAATLAEIGLAPNYAGQTGPFAGSSHAAITEADLGGYPTTVTGPTGEPVHIVTAWSYAYGLGVLDLELSAEGIVQSAEGGIVIPVEEPFLRADDSGNRVEVGEDVKAEIMAAIEASPVLVYESVSPTVEAIIEPYRAEIAATRDLPIGTVAVTMDYARIPTPFAAGETPSGSYAAHVVARAFRETNPRIDVAIQNAGGVRTQLLAGSFTVGSAINALPFSNTVVMLDMTGAEIVRVLNEAAHYALHSGSTGAFPYSAGLRYDVDLAGDEQSVILNVEVQDRATGRWSPISTTETYTVSTNSFTALGRDNYLTFATVREANAAAFEDTYINYFVPLKEYIEGLPNQTLTALDPAEYCLKSVR